MPGTDGIFETQSINQSLIDAHRSCRPIHYHMERPKWLCEAKTNFGEKEREEAAALLVQIRQKVHRQAHFLWLPSSTEEASLTAEEHQQPLFALDRLEACDV